MDFCDLSETFVTSLANQLTQNNSLKELGARGNKAIGSVPSFAAALCSSSVQTVISDHCDLNEAFAATLSNHLRNNTCLKILNICRNTAIGSDPNFAESLFQSALEKVDLRGCKVSPEFISVFLSCAAGDSNNLKFVPVSEEEVEEQRDKFELSGYVFLL